MISSRTFAALLFAASLSLPQVAFAREPAPHTVYGVGPQYDTTHVYVAPDDVDKFVASFLATFGGQSTKQVVATVTPTPSSTTSQLLQTPVGTVSLFGFKTPIPYPFGAERTGYLVTDIDAAVKAARAAGADVLLTTSVDTRNTPILRRARMVAVRLSGRVLVVTTAPGASTMNGMTTCRPLPLRGGPSNSIESSTLAQTCWPRERHSR